MPLLEGGRTYRGRREIDVNEPDWRFALSRL
jgi:hypothetical protein